MGNYLSIRYVGAYECKYITPVACVANDPFFKYSTFGHNENSYVFLNQTKNMWHPKNCQITTNLFSTSKGICFQSLKGWTHPAHTNLQYSSDEQ